MIHPLVRSLKLIILIFKLFRGWFIFAGLAANDQVIKNGVKPRRVKKIQSFLDGFLKHLNIEITVHGCLYQPPCFLVSNHISWLDTIILTRLYHGHFIAKSEIRSWPLLGQMIAGIGTLFIKRGVAAETRRIGNQLQHIIENQESVIFFPEAKTGPGDSILKIHSGLFQYAINAQMDIQPLVLVYEDSAGRPAGHISYVGETSLGASVWNVLGEPRVKVEVHLLEKFCTKGYTRKQVAEKVQLMMQQCLSRLIHPS